MNNHNDNSRRHDTGCRVYRGKYRIPSARLQTYDYRSPGWYFVTICTKDRVPWFGNIQNGIMGLSDVGCVVADIWQRIPFIRDNVQLDSWILMPDHIHGIIIINDIDHKTIVEADQWSASTDVASLIPLSRRTSNSLGSIIAQFKSVCTKRITSIGYPNFAWQTRFYDSILWDIDHINNVRRYIRLNPIRWKK